MGYHVFVSYSTQDKLFVDALVNRLESAAIRCWYAPRDIPPGTTWPAAIAQAIKDVPLMLLVFSGHANASQEVSRELTLASSNKCLVIPVRIENVFPSVEMEYHLSNRHWLDVYGLEVEAAINSVLETLQRHNELFQHEVNPLGVVPPLEPNDNASAVHNRVGNKGAAPPSSAPRSVAGPSPFTSWLRTVVSEVKGGACSLGALTANRNMRRVLAGVALAACAAGAVFLWNGREIPLPAPVAGATTLGQLVQKAEQQDLAAMRGLGEYYLDVGKAPEKAVPWLQKAAEQGSAAAMVLLGDMHYGGLGIPKNMQQAVAWYRRAADAHFPAGQTSLASLYEQGMGVEQDLAQARFWYEKAAAQGDNQARYALGALYENGEGVPASYATALRWYKAAAAEGYATAQYKMGAMYHMGMGVQKDVAEARRWLQLAVEQGDAEAKELLGQIQAQ
ncbi:toll/interleukin-1 receptor domain-containing protein [Desulfovibrio cuneatus]|uniref:toll/interleukin-1 receptor domain-containing protein n=1 Tax=Desulfovibrio cuneatus TaxID=159728 RepID=UPI00041C81FE|nr:toll/interleukin-1 receptor domain-containing protein [Desulfovibrio cuneatus]